MKLRDVLQLVNRKFAKHWARSAGRSLVVRVALVGWVAVTWLILSRIRHFASANFFVAVYPINVVLAVLLRHRKYPNSVLHVSYMVHVPYYATRILRHHAGMKADYLAVGAGSPWWDKCDYHFTPNWPPMPWHEFAFFWKVVARYEVIHCHFGISLSETGWDLEILRRLGRKIVIHYRGCEVREPERIKAESPKANMCHACDYGGSVCREGKPRVALSRRFGDTFLVTTPDMKDFVPDAIQFPLFAPELDGQGRAIERTDGHSHGRTKDDSNGRRSDRRAFKIVHTTNHPGIEGTERIQEAVGRLRQEGFDIDFVFLRGVPPERVIEETRDADLAIGKMQMGFYANAQIESMALGVPTVTYVRPDFMTEALERSGFIICSLSNLEETLRFYLSHPEKLAEKRRIARESILALHDNERLAHDLVELYTGLKMNRVPARSRVPV